MNRITLGLAALVVAAIAAACDLPAAPGQPTSPPPTSTAQASSTKPTTTPPATTGTSPPATRTSAPPTTTPPTTTPSPAFPPSLLGKDLEVIPTSAKIVALTFDAGANGDGVASILATLDSESITATFFLTGDFAQQYPALVQAIVARGHRLANHTESHPHLPALSDSAALAEITQARTHIMAAGGTDPRPLFRFPYGDRNAHTIALVNGAGYAAVRWTVDTLGWKGTSGGITAAIVTDRVLDAARPGEIVMMHVGSNPTDHTTLDAQALPDVIDGLRGLGYSFVTLDVLLS